MSVTKDEVSRVMAELGRKGGKATGASKRRNPEHYKRMAQRSAEARKAKERVNG